jgi:proteic killer suppression protein
MRWRVEVRAKSRKLQKTCSQAREMERAYGKDTARRLRQRLAELAAADTLSDLSHLPPARCHALTGNLKDHFSVDLVHPYRLLFVPDHNPIPRDAQGGVDRSAVTAVVVVRIEDTH